MSAGVNRIAGRNNNKLDLNPEGSIEMSSVGSSITINSLITTSPNIIQPQTSIVLIPNPTSSITSSLETVSDIFFFQQVALREAQHLVFLKKKNNSYQKKNIYFLFLLT